MAFSADDIRANRDYFAAKLRAEKQKTDILHKVKDGSGDFLLLDVRQRDAFRKGHIQGALCVPFEELDELMSQLPKDKEFVTYCWNQF
jgi:rhodanese-related sulfurtransferase